jgi:hypothetical protein
MLIYCNGDSFAAGHGLSDNKITTFPGYWSYTDTEFVQNVLKGWAYGNGPNDRSQSMYKQGLTNDELYKLGKEEAWPARLAALLTNATMHNAAKQGSSHESILTRTLLDLTKYKQDGVQVDKVIIQLTSISRSAYPLIDEQSLTYEDRDVILSMSWPGILEKERLLSEWYVKYVDDTGLAIRSLRNIALLNTIVEQLTGKPPIFCDSSMFRNAYTTFALDNPTVQKYIDLLNLREIVYDTKMLRMEDIAKQDTLHCPCGHYAHELHQEFAELIASTYFNAGK